MLDTGSYEQTAATRPRSEKCSDYPVFIGSDSPVLTIVPDFWEELVAPVMPRWSFRLQPAQFDKQGFVKFHAARIREMRDDYDGQSILKGCRWLDNWDGWGSRLKWAGCGGRIQS